MDRISVGKIVNTHGIRGEVKIDVWMNDARDFCTLERVYRADGSLLEIERSRAARALAIVKFKGIDSIEQAEGLRGSELSADRSAIPLEEGEHFVADIIGLSVVDADTGEAYGKITDVYLGIANDAYEIELKEGKRVLFPAIPSVLAETDLEKGILRIRPIAGMFYL